MSDMAIYHELSLQRLREIVDKAISLFTAHFQSGKFRAEIAAIPFMTSKAIKLATADSRDDRRPDKASANSVPRLKRMNHAFLLISS